MSNFGPFVMILWKTRGVLKFDEKLFQTIKICEGAILLLLMG